MGSHYQGTKDEVRALSTYINLVRAAETILGLQARRLAAQGLTVSQFGVLEALYHLGPQCQKVIGAKLLKTSGNVTMVVDNLERNGLVKRKRDVEDKRFVTLHLTAKGKRRVEETLPEHVDEIRREMEILSPSEQDELRRLCRVLGKQQEEIAHGER